MKFEGGTKCNAVLAISPLVKQFPMGPLGTLLVDPAVMVVLFLPLDAKGEARLTATVPNSAVGITFYAQALQQDLSNAIAVRISK